MLKLPQKELATDCNGRLSVQRDLFLSELNGVGLWSLRPNASQDIQAFATGVFDQQLRFGEMINAEGMRLIQLWPNAAYFITEQISLPESAAAFESMLTDISHGFCDFNLSGDRAIPFLNDYTTTDLGQMAISDKRVLRTRLGQFQAVLWWDELTDIHMLIDRSYARSFCHYLQSVADRWCNFDLPQAESEPRRL
jgi:hypothetical protein